jgi:hypothetical protein
MGVARSLGSPTWGNLPQQASLRIGSGSNIIGDGG